MLPELEEDDDVLVLDDEEDPEPEDNVVPELEVPVLEGDVLGVLEDDSLVVFVA